jgi:hypothetical protein
MFTKINLKLYIGKQVDLKALCLSFQRGEYWDEIEVDVTKTAKARKMTIARLR